jgi:hypothetical protein
MGWIDQNMDRVGLALVVGSERRWVSGQLASQADNDGQAATESKWQLGTPLQ